MTTPKGAAAKARMLDATIALMRRSGLAGTGVNEIVAASGAPKGSVYHFFPDGKRQMAVEALGRYASSVHASMDEALSRARGPRAKVRALFALLERRLEDAGYGASCAVGAVTLDLDEQLADVRPAAAAAFDDWRTLIARHFDIADRRRRDAFAGLVLTAIQGGYVRGRAESSTRAFREAAHWLAEIAEREARPAA
ncbi:putative HTH-type transcriptional regulator [Burkholderiales bacterium]|nr:putative HTH-type transcriptional regulator [Burkholderiales bacterium]